MKTSTFITLGLVFLALTAPLLMASADEADVDMNAHASGTAIHTILNEEQAAAAEAGKETMEFQADVNRVMGLIINSLYSNKEIFLRELISNSADALSKVRVLSLTDPEYMGEHTELDIHIKADPEANTLTISDSGVGMTKEDLIGKLGSIASSGTKQFSEALAGKDSDLIGQFGVGFYAAYLVADTVTVVSKNNDGDQYIWESDATNEYQITKDPRGNTLGRGTEIILTLKEDALEFLDVEGLHKLAKKYSEFIDYPIYLWTSSEEEYEVEVEDDSFDQADSEDGDIVEGEDDEESESGPKTVTETRTVWDWELVNTAKPIWKRSKDEITEQEYNDFYKTLTGDTEDPLTYLHMKAEGEVDMSALLYIPKKAPADLFSRVSKSRHNIKLYVRRVFITSDFDVLPNYLGFVRGVVDSDSLPLNVSREQLQQSKMVRSIRKKLTRRVLDTIRKMARDEDNQELFDTFTEQFGTSMKLGLLEDISNRTKLSKILRFVSSKSGDGLTSLEEYVDRMEDKQEKIYYLAGDTIEQIEESPYLELLTRRGYEVLYLLDPVDEYALSSLPEFDGNKLINIAKDDLDLPTDESRWDELKEEFSALTTWLKVTLADRIEKAEISQSLVTSPVTLAASSWGVSPAMRRIIKSQASAGENQQEYLLHAKPIMQINPFHPLIKALAARVEADDEDEDLVASAETLFGAGAISSGFGIDEPAFFVSHVLNQLSVSLDVDPEATVDYEDLTPPPEEEETEADDEDADEEEDIAVDEVDHEDL